MTNKINCNLSESLRTKIDEYTRKIIRKEIAIETILYIKNEQQVEINDAEFSLNYTNKVEVSEIGAFNPKDFKFCLDFMNEPTGKIKYAQNKYIHETIGENLCNIVKKKLRIKYEELTFDFLKNIDIEALIDSQIFRKSNNSKKAKPINIHLEIYKDVNFGDYIDNKIQSKIKHNLETPNSVIEAMRYEPFYNFYLLGCKRLELDPNSIVKPIDCLDKSIKKQIEDILIKQYAIAKFELKDVKNIPNGNLLTKNIEKILTRPVTDNVKSIHLFIAKAKNYIREYFSCRELSSNLESNKYIEAKLPELIDKIAIAETYLYVKHSQENINTPSIEELMQYDNCKKEFAINDIVFIIKNAYIGEATKEKILSLIPLNPKDEYPYAREMKRKFFIHVGYTNTGKTYSSIEKLKASNSGVYLSPLRLLALEIQEKLNNSGVLCSLSTGEEEDVIPDAKHISATVERLDLIQPYDVCVIDECQMINDTQRGYAWVRAILGVLADEIYLCTAPEALDILIKLINDCGDEYEIINHSRDTELVFVDNIFDLNRDLQDGDALIVFTKKDVLAVASDLLNKNIKASIIYGSLPYSTRKEQFQRFLNKETNIIISTDAIGMGLNLPIKRVIFLETLKFDGQDRRKLKEAEIKQIAGRAGRKGMYNTGYVLSKKNRNLIKDALTADVAPIKKAYVGFSEVLLNINEDLSDILKVWKSTPTIELYKRTDINRALNLIQMLKDKNIDVNVSNALLLKIVSIPFDEKRDKILRLWIEYCQMYLAGIFILGKPEYIGDELSDLEDYYKCLDLYYSFCKKFDLYIDLDWLKNEKLKVANTINNILVDEVSKHGRYCKKCGKKLSWDYPYSTCSTCYNPSRFSTAYDYDIDNDAIDDDEIYYDCCKF